MADDPDYGGKRRRTWFLTGTGLAVLAFALAGDLTLNAQTQRGLQSPHPRVLDPLPIDWAAVSNDYDPDRSDQLKQLEGFELRHNDFNRTALPILMPGPASGISTRDMTFSSVGDAYGMALPQEQLDSDVTVVITATRVVVDAAPGTFEPTDFETLNVGGARVKALVEPTESGWTASFKRYGAIYSIDVDCGNTGAGSPCQDAGYIRRVAANLSDITLGKRGEDSLPDVPDTDYGPTHSAQWDQPARYPRERGKDWDRTNHRGGSSGWGYVPNRAPHPFPDHFEIMRNRTLSTKDVALLQNDTDPDGDKLVVSSVSNPVNGTVSFTGGEVRFVPNEGFTGEASFDYTVSDGGGHTATTSVSIMVDQPEQPPSPPPPVGCKNADGRAVECPTPAAKPTATSPATPRRPNNSASDQDVR